MNKFEAYLKTVSRDALNDIANNEWDEVMADALFAAIGAETAEEMREAKREARSWAEHMVSRRS